jgi:hypothetical protein
MHNEPPPAWEYAQADGGALSFTLSRAAALARKHQAIDEERRDDHHSVGKPVAPTRHLSILAPEVYRTRGTAHRDDGWDASQRGQPVEEAVADEREGIAEEEPELGQEQQDGPSEVIDNFYQVLAYLPEEYKRLSAEGRKRMVRQVIKDVRLNAVSPHGFLLHVT